MVGAAAALYVNVFVLVVQLFLRIPALAALAPTQSEWPFLVAQLVLLVAFVVLGVGAVKRAGIERDRYLTVTSMLKNGASITEALAYCDLIHPFGPEETRQRRSETRAKSSSGISRGEGVKT